MGMQDFFWMLASMARHHAGDWGELCDEDRHANEQALALGGRLFSVYHDRNGAKFYIFTECDRSVTTVLCEPKQCDLR